MHPTRAELRWFFEQARPRRWRTLREFAEQEIVIPSGPFAGRRFRCDRQPYTRLWFDAVDSGLWTRFVATGPTQSGKTLTCFIIPLLYHLFEIGETVVCGLPDMDMAADKWREDLLPVIEQSRYRDLLPQSGGGSRGGKVESLRFGNGATLKFMSGGGGDKSRAGFSTRIVVITETDGMDEASVASRESDKITQLEARTRAHGRRARVYMECTVSTEHGRTWQEYVKGTRSRIVLPCPHCQAWVSPEREHLIGWQAAQSQPEARTHGVFCCPDCKALWDPEQRIEANRQAMLLHEGQEIDDNGTIKGESPATDTLGFRWSAVHNLFLTPGEIAADEWRAARSADDENAERAMRQFVWCIPVAPTSTAQVKLEWTELAARGVGPPRGIVPAETRFVTVGVDIGKYLLHWVVVAWQACAVGHIVDYGCTEAASDDLGVEHAVLVALKQIRDSIMTGWPVKSPDSGQMKLPDRVWIDAGYLPEVVHTFCRQAGNGFTATIGRGTTQTSRHGAYTRPNRTGSVIKHLGEGFHVCWLQAEHAFRVEIDADYWKSRVHQRLHTPLGQAGAMTLYAAPPQQHLTLAKHLTAEQKVESFIAGRGVVTQWERVRRQNHYLDALSNACVAGSMCGVRLVATPKPTVQPVARVEQAPQGRPWIDQERCAEMAARLAAYRRDR